MTDPARLPRPRVPGGSARWAAAVLACAVLGALAGPALGDADREGDPAEGTDREDEPAEGADREDGPEATARDDVSVGDLGLPPGGDADEGRRLYAEQCARCHGPAGRGGETAPALHDLDVARVDLVLRTNRMPPATESGEGRGSVDWSDERRADLLAYAAEEFDLTGSIPQPGPGDPTVGRRFYASNCAACHGYTGDGGVAGGGAFTPRVAGHDPVTVAEAIRVGPFQMPRFGPFQVPDDNLADVAAYLQTTAEEEGTPLFGLVEMNPVHASGFVALFAVVVLASCMWLGGRVLMFPDPRRAEPHTEDSHTEESHTEEPHTEEPRTEGDRGRHDHEDEQEGGQP